MKIINIRLGEFPIKIFIGHNCFSYIIKELLSLPHSKFLLISDPYLIEKYPIFPKERIKVMTITPSENEKTIRNISNYIEKAIELDINQSSAIISFGGGLCGNIAGVMAAMLYMGIPLYHIPTTTVAMFDSAISIRHRINSQYGKNLIGLFYPPTKIFIDSLFVKTLPLRFYRSGLVEFVKTLLVSEDILSNDIQKKIEHCSPSAFEILQDILEYGINLKVKAIKEDPYEKYEGLKLHYGHEFGNIFEYISNGKILHGEAVALGMFLSAKISKKMGYLSSKDYQIHNDIIKKIGINFDYPHGISPEQVISFLKNDRIIQTHIINNELHVPLVLLERIGHPLYNGIIPKINVPLSTVEFVLKEWKQNTKNNINNQ
ncbi:MAG: hypothetical protein KAW87_08595 [Candidatus Cloacimonetes bacterium]|nr:hypothetical protein [Candidatus Cloacimonadota bacterium]